MAALFVDSRPYTAYLGLLSRDLAAETAVRNLSYSALVLRYAGVVCQLFGYCRHVVDVASWDMIGTTQRVEQWCL